MARTLKKQQTETDQMFVLMRLINENPSITQRDISAQMGLSLGKINYLVHAMVEKGFIKVQNFRNSQNKISYLYNLTPSGMEAKAKTTYHFLKRKMDEYEKLEQEIRQLKEEISYKF